MGWLALLVTLRTGHFMGWPASQRDISWAGQLQNGTFHGLAGPTLGAAVSEPELIVAGWYSVTNQTASLICNMCLSVAACGLGCLSDPPGLLPRKPARGSRT